MRSPVARSIPLRLRGTPAGESRLSRERRDSALGLAMIAVPVATAVIFGVAPLISIAWYSLHDWAPLTGEFTFSGIDNYVALAGSPTFRSSLLVTGLFVVGVVVTETVVALMLALLINRRIPAIGAFRAAYFAPVVIAYAAWAIVWDYLLASNGAVNTLLGSIGIEGPDWLHEPGSALGSMIIIVLFKGVGQNMILFLAALQAIPHELHEAAQVDGAKPFRRFRSITFPLLSPTVMMVLILTTVGALNVFVPVQMLTQGGPGNSTNVLSYYLYKVAFVQQEFGMGSAIGIVLFAIVLALTLLQWSLRKRWVHDEH